MSILTPRMATVTLLLGAITLAVPLPAAAQSLDEIIVTARKKDENLQDIPVSVTAVSSDMIQRLNIIDLTDISKMTAGLQFDAEFNRTSNRPIIRGQANILGASGVSYFIDGVYITGSINDYDINDIERMEIVKGPQSALYGRNTYSGAINIVTKSPDESLSSRVQVRYADDGMSEIAATIKGPITETLGGGLTARVYNHDGAFTNAFDGSDIGEQESQSISGVLTFAPNDVFDARLRLYHNETNDGQPALFGQPASANNCFEDDGALYQGLGRYFCGTVAPQQVNTDWRVQVPDARDDSETTQMSLAMNFDIKDNMTLTSITGFNTIEGAFVIDGDYQPTSFQVANFTPGGFPFAGFPVPPFDFGYVGSIVDFTFAGEDEVEDFSQEFRLTIDTDTAEFMLGAYYFDENRTDRDMRVLPDAAAGIAAANFGAEFGRMQGVCAANPICGSIVPFFGPTIDVPRNTSSLDTTNTAFFAAATFDFGDNTTLRIEGRYAEEELSQVAVGQSLGGAADPAVFANETFDSFTTRITVDHSFNENTLGYAVFSTGTKPGGFNGVLAIQEGLPTFDEEEIDSFEVGLKNVLLDGQLVANVALYHNQLEGYQITQNVRSGANTTSATANAGEAEITGVELEMNYRPAAIDGLTLTMNYALTDAKFVDGFDENVGLLNDTVDDGLINCSIGDQFPEDADCQSLFGSIDGNRIPRTAEHMLFLDAEYNRPLGSGDWNWYVGANYAYESSKFAQVLNLAETGNTALVNARLGFTNGRYSISLWGNNLTGEDSTPLVLRYADANDSFKRSFVGTARRDTHFGLTASVNFE
ncbi:MAG: TonB-dependent receptor [Pseudomonadota bacterium]